MHIGPEIQRLKGNVSIHRTYGAKDSEVMRIEVQDKEARVTAFTIYLSLNQFAEIITGHSGVDCEFEYSSLIGTKGENKEELVPIPDYDRRKPGWEKKCLKPFEVDGWWARSGDISNGHRHVKKDGKDYQRVVFYRNVPKKEGK